MVQEYKEKTESQEGLIVLAKLHRSEAMEKLNSERVAHVLSQ